MSKSKVQIFLKDKMTCYYQVILSFKSLSAIEDCSESKRRSERTPISTRKLPFIYKLPFSR